MPAVLNRMYISMTTAHAPPCWYHHPFFHIHLTHIPTRTRFGQHFSLFLGEPDTRKHLPQLPERTDRPAHTATMQQCTMARSKAEVVSFRAQQTG